ncbi:MAG: pyruvate formate lyase activating enzyme [Clostridia bacterium]|nr:pyruvate formate lyase activating enzyme [Clostridia bacterium]MDN5324233.1 pyruvate formate lyase activating enzyme [Clostridia bacterium]
MNTIINSGVVFNIQYYSIHDGSGIRTLVFLKGCPLRCEWCSNPESQSLKPEVIVLVNRCIGCGNCIKICSEQAIVNTIEGNIINRNKCIACGKCTEVCNAGALQIKGKFYTVDDLLEQVMEDAIFYEYSGGGITLSGGEPFFQADFTYSLLRTCKESRLNTAVETCGFVPYETIERCLPYLDSILYDIKHLDTDIHKQFTGADNLIILENVRKLAKTDVNLIIRVPVIPGINDSNNNLIRTAEFVKELGLKELYLLPYHSLGVRKYSQLGRKYKLNINPPTVERINEIKEILIDSKLNIYIGG